MLSLTFTAINNFPHQSSAAVIERVKKEYIKKYPIFMKQISIHFLHYHFYFQISNIKIKDNLLINTMLPCPTTAD